MSRVIAIMAWGFALGACSASLPSLTFLKSAPPTEVLRIESDPPGAEARTTQGQSCRTPCELKLKASSEFSVIVSLDGYQPQTVPVAPGGASRYRGTSGSRRPHPHLPGLRPIPSMSSWYLLPRHLPARNSLPRNPGRRQPAAAAESKRLRTRQPLPLLFRLPRRCLRQRRRRNRLHRPPTIRGHRDSDPTLPRPRKKRRAPANPGRVGTLVCRH